MPRNTEPSPTRAAHRDAPPSPARDRAIPRRAALGAIAATASAYSLWPIKPRAAANTPRGRVVLRYWEKWTGPEGDAAQRVVDRFNRTQNRTWVVRVPIADITSKAMVAIAGGDPPDLLGLFSYSVPRLAAANAAMAIDQFASRSSDLDPSIYAPAVARLLTINGRQWAGVNTCYTLALYYNKARFRDAGLDPEKPPQTITQLDAAADSLTRRDPSGNLVQPGFLHNLPGWWPYFWPVMFGGKLFDESTQRATITSAECLAAYSWVRDGAAGVGPAQATRFASAYGRSFHSPQDPFFSGRLAMIVQGPWVASFLKHHAPGLEYGCVPVPVADHLFNPAAPRGLLESDVLVIPRGCPHPDEAFDFFKFMQRHDVQEELAAAHGKSSPMSRASHEFTRNHVNPYVHVHDAIAKSPAVEILPQTTEWQAYSDLTIGAFESIWSGADPAATLQKVQSRAQQLIDREAALRPTPRTPPTARPRRGVP